MAKKKHKSIFWLIGVSFVSVGLLLFCQFYFGDSVNENTTFYDNTYINGINVSGMKKAEAESLISTKMLANKDDIKVTLTLDGEKYTLNGSDFEAKSSIEEPLSKVLAYGRDGNIFNKKKVENKVKREGLRVNLSYKNILGGFDDKIDDIIEKVEGGAQTASILFNPDAEEMFSAVDVSERRVDRVKLVSMLDSALAEKQQIELEIPLSSVTPVEEKEDLIKKITLRSKYKTSYATSGNDRKSNVKKALSAFNGMIVMPGQEVSFNKTTGPRSEENGYKKANIILNGVYVSGAGGGVCQASSTLYNALCLADIEILQSAHHSLPASYVPLSFDAMVSEGYSDLVFKNTTDAPIYIKAYGDDNYANVEIYGQKFDDGLTLRTRSELVKVLGHSGDKIIADTNGEYSNYVLYKGEYHRLKYPREGYETKGYLQYIKDGEVVKEKLLRHDFYWPQNGIVVEGGEKLGEGMTLPASSVKLIPAQKVTDEAEENIRHKLEKMNPSETSP